MPFHQVDGLDVYYRWSPAETDNGPTLVLFHGLGSSHAYYAPLIPLFNERGYSCLSIDTPGSGLSGRDGRDRSVEEIAGICAGFDAYLDSGRNIIVVGHSMGSMVACDLARRVKIAGAVLIGPVHPTPELAEVFNARIVSVRKSGLESLADSIPTAATGIKSTPLHHAFVRSLILSQTPEGYISLCKTIAYANPPNYSKIEAPLLIVAGSDDKTSPISSCETILQGWSDGYAKNLEVLDGVGHWHCIEAPNDVATKVIDFVEGILYS